MKYVAVFLRKIGEYKNAKTSLKRPNFIKIGLKEFSPKDETIDFKENTSFGVQLEAFSYQDKDRLYYYYDFDSGDLIGLETLLNAGIKPKDLNKVTGRKAIEQLVSGANKVAGNPLIYMIIPIVAFVAGILIDHFLISPPVIVQPSNSGGVPSVATMLINKVLLWLA